MLTQISYYLVIIGGVDLGLRGLGGLMGSNWDVLNLILGSVPTLENIVYILVGVAAIMMVVNNKSSM